MKKIMFTVFLSAVLPCATLYTQALTADEIVEKTNLAAYYQGDNGKARVSMTITDSLGRERKREMTILRLDVKDGGGQKFYVYFHKPSDVQGMTYLVWKHPGRDDDRWLYLPALDLVRRIAAGDKRSSFVGSNFVYEDISGRGVEEDEHILLQEQDGYYSVKSTPENGASVEFSYFVTLIDKSDFMPVKAEYYDKSGKLYRVIEALKVESIEGFPTITKMKASDFNSGGNTVSEFSDVGYNTGIEDNIFTERYLRRPPRQYIK